LAIFPLSVSETDRACLIRNADGLVAVPAGVVTVMGPELAPAGTVTVICVGESTVNTAAEVPLNLTAVVPVRFVPVITTVLPTAPPPGLKDAIVPSGRTVTVNEHVLVLAEVSVAVAVTVVVPTGKKLPDAGDEMTVTPGKLSVAVGAKVTTAPPGDVSFAVMFAGHVIEGGCVSLTLMVKVHVTVLLAESVAVAVSVVVPTGKKLPDAGETTTVTGRTPPLTVGAG
jgi:hypothetical protein